MIFKSKSVINTCDFLDPCGNPMDQDSNDFIIAFDIEDTNIEVFEFTEEREDKRFFKFLIKNDSNKETIKVLQGGRGFNVDWELD